MNPKVSIIIPCYNMGKYLQETIDSVVSSTNFSSIEMIIVNDGSTDQPTLNLLKTLSEQGLHIVNQYNMGLAAARNNGIKLAKGKFILPLDADNKIRPNYIQECLDVFENNDSIDVIYGNRQHFDDDDELVQVPDFDFPLLCHKNYIDACACFRKSIWQKVNGYDENMPIMGYEDWDFWLRIALQGASFHHLNVVTFDYRVRVNSMISSTNKNYDLILNYMLNKKELAVMKPVKEAYIEANHAKHLRNSMEYRIGKILLSPFRLFQQNK